VSGLRSFTEASRPNVYHFACSAPKEKVGAVITRSLPPANEAECEPAAATPSSDHKTTHLPFCLTENLRIGPLSNPTNSGLRNQYWHLRGHNMKQPGAHVGHRLSFLNNSQGQINQNSHGDCENCSTVPTNTGIERVVHHTSSLFVTSNLAWINCFRRRFTEHCGVAVGRLFPMPQQ
jgi:hypothetical protein